MLDRCKNVPTVIKAALSSKAGPLLVGCFLLATLSSCTSTSPDSTEFSVECPLNLAPICASTLDEIADMECAEVTLGAPREYFHRYMGGDIAKTAEILITAFDERADAIGCDIDPCPGLATIFEERSELVSQGAEAPSTVTAVRNAQRDQDCV